MMELQHSCILPSNAPALPEPELDIRSRVLQKRSGNGRQGYVDSSGPWKQSPSSPIENIYSHNLGGSHFTGNYATELNGDKSEEQIEQETKRLLRIVRRCEKYIKYRERQPQTTKEKEQRWPDHMEEAFFRALVRWPPMGRRKLMHDGQLRGRNELVSDSIYRETGILRKRKQVSSHIQVIKGYCRGLPQILTYLSKEDWGARKKRHVSAHLGHLRSRHDPSSYPKYELSQSNVNPWQAYGLLSSSRRLAHLGNESEAPYTVAHFAILLQDRNTKYPVHQFTGLSDNPRQGDLDVKDIASWHKQYPELNFHQTEEWRDRSVVVCDASIKVMADRQSASEKQPPCNLAIEYYINSQRDLSEMEPMQSRTRFYDEGELVDQYDENEQGNDNGREEPKKETWADCQYANSHSRMLRFASNFWARRMAGLRTKLQTAQAQDEDSSRVKIENGVRRQLQCMTAVQDIFGTSKETGEQHCFLTILWRFRQTRTPSEAGKMTWRVVNFGSPAQQQQCQPWIKDEQTDNAHDLRMILNSTTADPSPSIYPSLSLDLAHQTFAHQPPPLDLDSLSHIPMDSLHDFSAPSMSADYSQTQSLPSLTHSQDIGGTRSQDFHDPNDIDFQGGHIHMNILEPAINFGAYEDYTTHAPSLHHMNSLVGGLEPPQTDSPFGDLNFGAVTMASGCYPSKPWNYNGLITHLEGVAEQTQSLDQTSHAHAQDDIAGHGVLHDGQLGSSLWKLQAPFGEDATMGALEGRREGQGSVNGGGLLELIERDQRRGKDFRGF